MRRGEPSTSCIYVRCDVRVCDALEQRNCGWGSRWRITLVENGSGMEFGETSKASHRQARNLTGAATARAKTTLRGEAARMRDGSNALPLYEQEAEPVEQARASIVWAVSDRPMRWWSQAVFESNVRVWEATRRHSLWPS